VNNGAQLQVLPPEGGAIDAVTARVLDANLNRAREALRVMEEYARFVLDDGPLVERVKELRHALASAVEAHDLSAVVRGRDIVGDVGCSVESDREYVRSCPADVAAAAGKRLGEALRVVEEYGKVADSGFARRVEQLRYSGYEVERRLLVRIDATRRLGQVRLYVLVTEALCQGDWFAVARAALDGGADCLQLREKSLPDGELLERATRLAELCASRGALFVVNDRPDIAVGSGAAGVHVGQEDLPPTAARRVVGPTGLIGVSTHSIQQVFVAVEQSPDYIAVGPMFASSTKPQDRIAGPKMLAEARRLTSLPLVAIGGIDASNVQAIVETGCRCVCVCSGVISQPDPAAAAARIRERLAD